MNNHEHRPTSVDEHAALVRDLLDPLSSRATERVPLADALDRMTASAVLSPVDLPLFRNSQMDGFAVVAADLQTIPATLPIVGEIAARAGQPPALQPGTAVRIMTGAVVPDGADAVVPKEDTATELGSSLDGASVTIRRARSVGDNMRDRGSDLRAGEQLLPGGLRLGSRHLAVLAAAGLGTVEVSARVRVAIITTGAELIAPGEAAAIGQVYDANSVALVAAVQATGASVGPTLRVGDDREAMLAALRDAAANADLIVTSGGISMGDYEVVREVLEPLGGTVGHIAMQPGGPQATAVFEGVPVISFPGNPVSTQLSFEVFVAPILRQLAGLPAAQRRSLSLVSDARSVAGKRQFLRGRALDGDRVQVVSGPGSHLVAGLAASDLLIDIPAETTELKAGSTVETWTL